MLISPDFKIFIAGHTGMVGSAIKRNLIKKGYRKLLCPDRNHLDLLNIDLGSGKRKIVDEGALDEKYKITVPKSWKSND